VIGGEPGIPFAQPRVDLGSAGENPRKRRIRGVVDVEKRFSGI
jgi:hypothetical protein